MPWNDLLVRDSLQDTGTTPSPGYPYTSPDVICTQLTTYTNPTSVFTPNYGSDPNMAAVANQQNYFYVRAKNLGTTTITGTMYLYWTQPSLLMTPNQWISQPLMVKLPNQQMQGFYPFPAASPNAIVVLQLPFIWPTQTYSHLCMVGICSTPLHPWNPATPPNFNNNVEEFVLWVRNTQNVCWRNVAMITNPNIPEWDATAGFNNQWTEDHPLLVTAYCTNVPVNSTIQLICTALGINYSTTVTTPNQIIYAPAVTCPAGFTGYIETIAQTPPNVAWPTGARVDTVAYVGADQARVGHLAPDFGTDIDHPHVRAAFDLSRKAGQGTLVEVGCNTVTYNGL